MNNYEKGEILEDVMESIERYLLASNPAIKNHNLTIERKKRISVHGVLHEIDLCVRVDLGNGYDSTYIFECKNWKFNIDKNEVIILTEKINALNASKGFFIAKGFSRYAKAQAKKDKRIELVIATEETKIGPFETDADTFDQKIENTIISLFEPEAKTSIVSQTQDNDFFLHDKKINLIDFAINEIEKFLARKYRNKKTHTEMRIVEQSENPKIENQLEPGIHSFEDQVCFYLPEAMNLKIGERKIGMFHAVIKHVIVVTKPIIQRIYDIEKRGRVIYYLSDTEYHSSMIKNTIVEEAEFYHQQISWTRKGDI